MVTSSFVSARVIARVGGDAARLTKVGEHRSLVGAVLELPVELRERDHGAVELAGEDLQPTRDLRDLDLAVLDAPRRARRHQLQVVDDDQPEVAVARLRAPRLGAHLHHRAVRVVVDEQRRLGETPDRVRQARPLVFADLARSAGCASRRAPRPRAAAS